MELFTLFGKIAVNGKEANKEIDSVTGKAKQSEGKITKTFSNIGKVVAGAFAVGAVVEFEKNIISTYATYDDQMRKVQAVSGATGKQFMDLRAKAEDLGAKTRFSATEAGQGMENLARAGWKTGEIMQGIGPVLSFATANAIDLGSAAGIVSNGLSQFGLKAKDTTMFTDVLSATAASANTDINLLGETFKYCGAPAGALGYKLQDVAVAIGLMANKGIVGSQAGTTLRSAMTRLANPTGASAKAMKKLGISLTDSTGKVKPFTMLMQELRGKFSKLTDAQKAQYASTIFGQEAMSGMLAVVNSSDEEFNKMTKAIAESEGQTQKMADTMDGGLGGAIAGVKSAWENLLIQLGKMQDGIVIDALNGIAQALRKLPQVIITVNNKFKQFNQFLKQHKTTLQVLGVFFGVFMTGFVANAMKIKIAQKGILGFIKTFNLVKNLGGILKGLGSAFTFLLSPVGLVTAAVAGFAAAAFLIYKNWDKIGPWIKNLWQGIKNVSEKVWNGLKKFFASIWKAITTLFITTWEGIKLPFQLVWEFIKAIVTSIITIIKAIIQTELNIIKAIWEAIWNSIKGFVQQVWNSIKNIIQTTINIIKNIITTVWNAIKSITELIWNGIKLYFTTIWNIYKTIFSTALNIIKTLITTTWNAIKNITTIIWNVIKEFLTNIWDSIKTMIDSILNIIKNIITKIWTVIKNITTTIWNGIKVYLTSIWEQHKAIFIAALNIIKNVVTTIWNTIKSVTTSVWNAIKSVISTIWNAIKSIVTTAINTVKSIIISVWNSIKSKTIETWNNVKSCIEKPIIAAKDTVKKCLDKIKGFFDKLKLKPIKIPHIKLPHFHIQGSFSLKPPSVPHLGVDWYAEGGILTKPTVFGMMNGRPQVGGEAGPEAVLPIEKLSGILAVTLKELGYGVQEKSKGDITVVQHITSPEHLNAYEISRQSKNKLRELAFELGMS